MNSESNLVSTDSTAPPSLFPSYITTGPHHFFIPVMGTGFTIDTPLRVARYGIASVVSIGDDTLIEQIRKHYSDWLGCRFVPIGPNEEDARSRRIQAYLDFLHDTVQNQMQSVCSSPFAPDSEITRYFELLPDGPLRDAHQRMLSCSDPKSAALLQESLRRSIVAGPIDVNIMTKIDREQKKVDGKWVPESGLAMTALRGFATSKLRSSIVLSAGINKRLFAYMATFDDFLPSPEAAPRKTIILKVSDYRSALLQGTLLARHGLWVSEYRIESGLNCGGHAFATKGQLMGPVLAEFQANRASLVAILSEHYRSGLQKLGRIPFGVPSIILSAQGGVGVHHEHQCLRKHYDVERVGWGTPFLFVPQATNVDLDQLRKLVAAAEQDVVLSDASPLGVPFWILRHTSSDTERLNRIADGKPGSRCLKRFLALQSESSDGAVCTASRQYQSGKLEQLADAHLPEAQRQAAIASVLAKTCLCQDLAGGVLNRLGIDTTSHPAVCCGKSAVDFDRVYTLSEMIDHIYGRVPIRLQADRPGMFLRELSLYVEYLRTQLTKDGTSLETLPLKYFGDFAAGLLRGIAYYRERLPDMLTSQSLPQLPDIMAALQGFERDVQCLIGRIARVPAGFDTGGDQAALRPA